MARRISASRLRRLSARCDTSWDWTRDRDARCDSTDDVDLLAGPDVTLLDRGAGIVTAVIAGMVMTAPVTEIARRIYA